MLIEDVKEGATVYYRATLKDGGDPAVPIPLAAILDLRLVRYYLDTCDRPLINARANLPLIVSGVVQAPVAGLFCTMATTSGKLVIVLPAADQAMQDPTIPVGDYEKHIAVCHVTHTGGEFPMEFAVRVENLGGIGAS